MVVLEPEARFPEGTAVRVTAVTPPAVANDAELDPIWHMGERAVDIGTPDLAVNIEHSLSGHPKVSHGKKHLP